MGMFHPVAGGHGIRVPEFSRTMRAWFAPWGWRTSVAPP